MSAWRTPDCRLHLTGVLIACGLMLTAGATSRAEGLTNADIDRMARKNPAALLGIRAPTDTLLDSAKANP